MLLPLRVPSRLSQVPFTNRTGVVVMLGYIRKAYVNACVNQLTFPSIAPNRKLTE